MNALRKTWWLMPAILSLLLLTLGFTVDHFVRVKMVYLWTDRLILVLFIFVLFAVSLIRKRPELRRPWRHVFERRGAMIAAMILLSYVVVALLDSIHFYKPLPSDPGAEVQYAPRMQSLLDEVLGPLRTQQEKTYSAPFATHSFAKETVEGPDGSRSRVYLRLKYGGAHLQDVEADFAPDVIATVLRALGFGLMVWLGIVLLVAVAYALLRGVGLARALRVCLTGREGLPWHAACYTLLVIVLLIAVVALLGPKYHILGTDKVGQDVFYLSVKSIRTGLVIGTLTTLVMLPFAVLLGTAAGYFRGWVDDLVQYLYTTLNSIPGVLLIAAAILSIDVFVANHPDWFASGGDRADLRLLALCLILGVTSWTGLCRLLRGETLKLRELEYVQAATAFGVRNLVILGRHVLPNVMHIVLIVVVLDFSGLVLAEAVLSYIGIGVDPSAISWGNMINGARLEMAREPMVWWSLVSAFVFMFVLVLAANLFSDAVRDAFDPRLSRAA